MLVFVMDVVMRALCGFASLEQIRPTTLVYSIHCVYLISKSPKKKLQWCCLAKRTVGWKDLCARMSVLECIKLKKKNNVVFLKERNRWEKANDQGDTMQDILEFCFLSFGLLLLSL